MTAAPMITADRLKEVATYDPNMGIFLRRVGIRGSAAGDVIGCKRTDGYICARIDKRDYLAHRLAWLYVTGKWPEKPYIDHKNGDPSDNRFANLREATQSEQNANTRLRKDNSSGARGVSWSNKPKGWRARISINGTETLLGYFASKEDAKWMYAAAARKYFGDFARAP